MLRFWGQPKYLLQELIGYELFIREYTAGQWSFPKNFGAITAKDFADALRVTLDIVTSSTQLVSINLDQDQFIMPDYIAELAAVQRDFPNIQLVVELTECHGNASLDQLVTAAAAYNSAHIWGCLDDVGTGSNKLDLVSAMTPYIQEYKFALQNFHNKHDFITSVSPQLQFWREQAELNNVFFAIEGFETPEDLKIAANYRADIMQGYYFGRPHLIQ